MSKHDTICALNMDLSNTIGQVRGVLDRRTVGLINRLDTALFAINMDPPRIDFVRQEIEDSIFALRKLVDDLDKVEQKRQERLVRNATP